MKIFKSVIILMILLIVLISNVFAANTDGTSFKATIDGGSMSVIEAELESDINNSDLVVKVIKITKDKLTVLYEGTLGGYDNGIWVFTDFNSIDYLVVLNWETQYDEAIYIIPESILNDKYSTTTPTNDNKDLSSTATDKTEPVLPINNVQLIEYDVTYSIVSDGSLSMDIDYNVYNGNSENDTVSLISALYENGRLSDIQTQSLSVDALDSNSDSILLPLPNNRENCSVKLMVWDGMNTIRPLGNTKQIVDLDNYTREKYMYISSNANVGFNVYMNAATVKGANADAIHTLKYDSSKITPVDLCGFTYNKELVAGAITNTNITIQNVDLSAGKIEYKINLEAGRNTGITNMVKFKTLSDVTDEAIVYTIQ